MEFDCDKHSPQYDWINSPWGENREIIYSLMSAMFKNPCLGSNPTIVELGSYLGCSTFCFAQAIKDNDINAKLFAIDTWQGDEFSGFYGDEIYQSFLKISTEVYPNVNIMPVRDTFDNAYNQIHVPINVLHIDGNHKYEDVSHDFNLWKQKLARKAVIIFHDVNVQKFGVKDFWQELTQDRHYPYYITIKNINGLGIVFKDFTQAEFNKYKNL